MPILYSSLKSYHKSYHKITLTVIVMKNSRMVSLLFSVDSLILANEVTSARLSPCLIIQRTHWPTLGVQRTLISFNHKGITCDEGEASKAVDKDCSMSELTINNEPGWNLSFLSTVQTSNILTLQDPLCLHGVQEM